MNPNILNYLQMQSQGMMAAPNNTGATPNSYGQPSQQAYAPMPAQNQGAQAAYNPFDSGIQKAIASARQSLGMTRDQEHGALRQALLAFGDNLGAQPKQSGFMNNLGSVGRALSPALQAYGQQEENAISQNNSLANQILRYQAQEEERAARKQERKARDEDRSWNRQFHENQLAETKRYHTLMNDLAQAKNGAKESPQEKRQGKAWDYRAKHNTTKTIPEITEQFEKNNELIPTVQELKTLLQNSKLAGGSKLAQAKRYIAGITGMDEDVMNADNLGKFYYEWMNENSKGSLSEKDAIRFEKTFATIDKNPNGAVQSLERLENSMLRQQDLFTRKLDAYKEDSGADLSQIRSTLFDGFKKKPTAPPSAPNIAPQEMIQSPMNALAAPPDFAPASETGGKMMVRPDGKLQWVGPEKMQEALEDGFEEAQ